MSQRINPASPDEPATPEKHKRYSIHQVGISAVDPETHKNVYIVLNGAGVALIQAVMRKQGDANTATFDGNQATINISIDRLQVDTHE